MVTHKLPATGAAQKPFANQRSYAGMSSPGGEETGEGELNSKFKTKNLQLPGLSVAKIMGPYSSPFFPSNSVQASPTISQKKKIVYFLSTNEQGP
jgi:hypothetical protein